MYTIKKFIFAVFIFFQFENFAQVEKSNFVIHNTLESTVISKIEILTGDIAFTTKLKEGPYHSVVSSSKDYIFAMTKHYAYTISYEDGSIINEYQYSDILVQESGELVDPNTYITPLGITDDGIGYYQNIMEEARLVTLDYSAKRKPSKEESDNYLINHKKALNNLIIHEVNFIKETNTNILKLDVSKYQSGAMPFLHNESLYLIKYDLNSKIISLEKRDKLNYEKITEIKYPLSTGTVDLNQFEAITFYNLNFTNNETPTLTVAARNGTNVKYFNYHYNLITQNPVLFKESLTYGMELGSFKYINCNQTFYGIAIPPEPLVIPIMTENPQPEGKVKRKEMVEWTKKQEKINKEFAEKSKLYQEALQKALFGGVLEMYADQDHKILIGKFNFSAKSYNIIYNDQYLFYNNGFEMVLYDFINKEEMWALSL
ncbi:hypothetical protein [Xanthomarina sp. F2636L]|uniref:hypothetical protein n=1 Tax=Xanthomarina sp. F2636L TaxID=2996018 RepID=UPI00225DE210|nr:hypothetical protein [Xanthomarina sp. F2636L]MCX7552096.1 hypothetical protein [Xanthomarina sp. F2636L]